MKSFPLAVDLDGTLVNTDVFFESSMWYIRKNPLRFFQMCWWFVSKGRVGLKLQIESRVALPVSDFPFNGSIIKWLRNEKDKGRTLVLVTGASQKYAEQVAEHLNLFSDVFGVCKERPRLTGRNKRRFLVERYGEKNFDYIGNSVIDLAVWKKARQCIVANAFPIIAQIAQRVFPHVQVLSEPVSLARYWSLCKKFFSILILRICVVALSVFSHLSHLKWTESQNAFVIILAFILVFPGMILLYISAFLLGELQDLGPHRKVQHRGIFFYINPYWGLLSVPLGVCAFIYTFELYGLTSFYGFLLYFVLECMRWTFRKYCTCYDVVLVGVLWFLGSMNAV